VWTCATGEPEPFWSFLRVFPSLQKLNLTADKIPSLTFLPSTLQSLSFYHIGRPTLAELSNLNTMHNLRSLYLQPMAGAEMWHGLLEQLSGMKQLKVLYFLWKSTCSSMHQRYGM
jgi:hypothetical protein